MSDGINHGQKIDYCEVCGWPKAVCRCGPAQVSALRYVDSWISSHLANDNLKPAYIAGLQDIRVNVQAAIERIKRGQPMECLSELANAE